MGQFSLRQKFDTAALWWNSDWGPGPLLRLAVPLMISAGFVSLTLFTDRTLLYWRSETDASAAMAGGSLYWSIICLPMGMLGYISTFVSQYRGANQNARIGAAYQHAMALAWTMVPILGLLIILAPFLFSAAGHTPSLVRLESDYLRILLVGGFGVLFYSVQSGLLTGQGRTATVLAIDGVSTAANLMLDAILIFGLAPIPALGIHGAALATTISFWLKIPIIGYIIAKDTQLTRDYQVGKRFTWEPNLFSRLITYGAPAGLQMLAEAGCFSIVMLQVGRLGEQQMAATSLALGLNVLVFIPMIGLGIGVGVLVGQHLTEGRSDLARRSVSCGLAITSLYTGLFALALGLLPDSVISVYSLGTDTARFAEIRPQLITLIRIVAAYCIFDGLQVVFVGAIKGAGDTWFVLLGTFFISLSAVCVGISCQEFFGGSLLLWWYIIAGWVVSMAIAFATRYFSGAWESKRVIECPSA